MRTYLFTTVFCLFLISCGMEEIPTYKLELTVSPSEGGKLNVSPSLPMHPEGSTVTITPEPNEHWVFKQWEGDGSGSSTPLQLIMDSNKSVVGIFIKRDYPLKITINGEGTVGEKIIPNPSGREYPHGTKVELTPIPKEGWLFDSWGGELSGNEVPKAILVDKEKNVTVNFKRRDYPLNITITGEGTVEEKIITNPNGKIYPFQTVVQLIPKPKDGWLFDSWGGDLSGKEQTKNITVDKEKNVAVKFVRKQPTFTLYKETYLNQRSGVAFWWYAGWGF
ncbi:MAG: InlB B-repeat-containing protein, partial [Algoriphagus sp.]